MQVRSLSFLYNKGIIRTLDCGSVQSQVFKLDWVIMSIIVLCLLAMILYAVLNRVEKWYLKKI